MKKIRHSRIKCVVLTLFLMLRISENTIRVLLNSWRDNGTDQNVRKIFSIVNLALKCLSFGISLYFYYFFIKMMHGFVEQKINSNKRRRASFIGGIGINSS